MVKMKGGVFMLPLNLTYINIPCKKKFEGGIRI